MPRFVALAGCPAAGKTTEVEVSTMSSNYPVQKKRVQGFGLLDVLITIFVLAVALLSLGGLHTAIIKSSSLAKARTNATSLAQEKLDDLRSFADSASDSIFAYNSIATGSTGGAYNTIPTSDNVTYGRNWYVYNFNMCGDNTAPTVAGATCTKTIPDMKLITMAVSWTDESNTARILGLQSAISNVSVTNSGAAYTPNYSGAPDFVLNTSYVDTNSDVISHDVGSDILKKASQPTPDSNRTNVNDSTFNTITTVQEEFYNSSNYFLGGSAFTTINCTCTNKTSVNGGNLPTQWNGAGYTAGAWDATKDTGVVASNQEDKICVTCCRDHRDDTADPTATTPDSFEKKFDPFRPYNSDYSSQRHNHYNTSLSSPVNTNNQDYIEACRMVWHQGRLQVLPDWRLEDIRIFPATFFNTTSNKTIYDTYVLELVKAYFNAITSSNYPSTTFNPPRFACVTGSGSDIACTGSYAALATATTNLNTAIGTTLQFATTSSPSVQMMARAIYIDYMTPDLVNTIYCRLNPSGSKPFAGSSNNTCDSGTASSFNDILYMVPFHDFNMTRYTTWNSSSTSKATVTSDTITNQNETSYSRGLVAPVAAGTSTLTATLRRSNTAWTDSDTIDPDDANFLSRSLSICVTSCTTTPTTNKVSGTISIATGSIKPNVAATEVTVTDGNNAPCKDEAGTGFTCHFDASGNGSITFTTYNKLNNNNTVQNNCIFYTAIPSGGTRSIISGPDGTMTESVTFTWTGQTGDINFNVTLRQDTNNGVCD
jgi:type II secretory pathway pseudopilin PulG